MFFEELHEVGRVVVTQGIGHLTYGLIGVQEVALGFEQAMGGNMLARTLPRMLTAGCIQPLRRYAQVLGVGFYRAPIRAFLR